ncbi:MAG: putative peptidoglycan binding domain-containing protein, partial [Actinoplanes sp.]
TSDVLADLRVDDHPDPVAELGRLLEMHTLYFERPDPATLLPLTGTLADEVRERLTGAGQTDPDLDEALASWAGIQNLEERLVAGAIDPLVLEQLRNA